MVLTANCNEITGAWKIAKKWSSAFSFSSISPRCKCPGVTVSGKLWKSFAINIWTKQLTRECNLTNFMSEWNLLFYLNLIWIQILMEKNANSMRDRYKLQLNTNTIKYKYKMLYILFVSGEANRSQWCMWQTFKTCWKIGESLFCFIIKAGREGGGERGELKVD